MVETSSFNNQEGRGSKEVRMTGKGRDKVSISDMQYQYVGQGHATLGERSNVMYEGVDCVCNQ